MTIIRKKEYDQLEKDFNDDFFESTVKRRQKEKELLKLERGEDYSEADYEYYMRNNFENVSKLSKDEDNENDDELDFDQDSDFFNKEEMKLNQSDEDREPFNPIKYLGEKLKRISRGLPETPPSEMEDMENISVEKKNEPSSNDSKN